MILRLKTWTINKRESAVLAPPTSQGRQKEGIGSKKWALSGVLIDRFRQRVRGQHLRGRKIKGWALQGVALIQSRTLQGTSCVSQIGINLFEFQLGWDRFWTLSMAKIGYYRCCRRMIMAVFRLLMPKLLTISKSCASRLVITSIMDINSLRFRTSLITSRKTKYLNRSKLSRWFELSWGAARIVICLFMGQLILVRLTQWLASKKAGKHPDPISLGCCHELSSP